MPQIKLTLDDIVFIMKMKKVRYSNREIARKLGVAEGAIRYRIKCEQSGKKDGRKNKSSELDRYRATTDQWIKDYKDDRRRPTIKTLHEWLQTRHGYQGSYDAFRRYIGKHFPEFHKKGVWIRVETPPGIIVFVDWKEDILIQIGEPDYWVKVHAFCPYGKLSIRAIM